MQAPFCHLHVHSEYSLADGLLRIDELVSRVAALGMPAVALTERDNLFSMAKFYKAAQATGVKLCRRLLPLEKPGASRPLTSPCICPHERTGTSRRCP